MHRGGERGAPQERLPERIMEHIIPLDTMEEFVESEALERLSTGLLEQQTGGFLVLHVVECVFVVQSKRSKTAREETTEMNVVLGVVWTSWFRRRWKRAPKSPIRRFSKLTSSLHSRWCVVALDVESEFERDISVWWPQETESKGYMSAWRWQEAQVLHSRRSLSAQANVACECLWSFGS